MSNSSQDDPICPCGSGLKLKRCHGSIINPVNAVENLPRTPQQSKLVLPVFQVNSSSCIL